MGSDFGKKLILINPPVSNRFLRYILSLWFIKEIPFSLIILAALTPKDYKIKFLKCKPLWFRKDFFKDALVGITCITASAKPAYKLAVRFRKAGASVVMGGPHVSVLPQEALQYCDSVVMGEAESVWKEVIRDFENRALKKIYKGEPLEDFFSPVYDYLLNLSPPILRHTTIHISRGCRYRCDFCACPPSSPRYANIKQLLQIIMRMKQRRIPPFMRGLLPLKLCFSDDNIFSSPTYAKTFFKELIPLKINWVSQSSIDIAFDEEALSLAKQSGCKSLFIGFETVRPGELKKTSVGNVTSTEDYIKIIRKIKSYGIKVTGSFIIGFDYYAQLDYLKLLFFLMSTTIRARFYWIALTILTPFPGSTLFGRLKQEDRIKTEDWNKYDVFFHVVFRPKITTLQLMLWFYTTRMLSLFCSTLGITIYISSVIGYYIVKSVQRISF